VPNPRLSHRTDAASAIVVKSSLKLIHEAKVDFDADLSHYGIQNGVLTNPDKGEIFAPVAMWLEAIDLVMSRLKEQGLDFAKVKGISGAGMQHGTVFWSEDADTLMGSLDPAKGLLVQLKPGDKKEGSSVFSHPFSPNWQDASTQKQCEEFDKALGSPEKLAEVTGSKAHHVGLFSCCPIQMENLSTDEMECSALQRSPNYALPRTESLYLRRHRSHISRFLLPSLHIPRQSGINRC
jgi:hypothetical protein